MAEKNNKTLERARFEMNYLTGDAAVRRLAELREKWEMDRNSDIYYAKEEIARKLLKMKLPIEQIAEATGLSKEEVEKLGENKEENNV